MGSTKTDHANCIDIILNYIGGKYGNSKKLIVVETESKLCLNYLDEIYGFLKNLL